MPIPQSDVTSSTTEAAMGFFLLTEQEKEVPHLLPHLEPEGKSGMHVSQPCNMLGPTAITTG